MEDWFLLMAFFGILVATFVAGAIYGRVVARKALALEQQAKDALIKGIEKL